MTALLDVPAIRERVARLSVEEYHRLGELPVELLRGTVIEKLPKSPLHQFYVDRVGQVLSGQISPDFAIRQEGPLTFADSEPEPDVAIVAGPAEKYLTGHPNTAELVVEVSLSSLELDRIKGEIYAEAGVKEYWIVCPDEQRVEVYRQPSGHGYAEKFHVANSESVSSAELPSISLDLRTFFVR
jgi:Uma2 family endonuclease